MTTRSGRGTRTGAGAAFNRGHRAVVTLVDSQIIDNVAYGRGGGFWNESGTVTLDNTDVTGNATATTDQNDRRGGGFWNKGHGVVNLLGDVEISGNTSIGSGNGGGRGSRTVDYGWVDGSTANSVEIIGNAFSGRPTNANHEGDGGGFYNVSQGIVTLNNATITGNGLSDTGSLDYGRSGGGFRNNNFGQVIITGGTVSDNTARGEGGGFYNSDHGVVQLTDVLIENNAADQGGGFYHVGRHGTVTLSETPTGTSTLQNNTARTNVGGGFSHCAVPSRSSVSISPITTSWAAATTTTAAAASSVRARRPPST